MSGPQLENTLRILDITLSVQPQFGKTVNRIKFQTGGGTLRTIPVSLSPGEAHREGFDDALDLSVQDQLKITLECLALFGRRASVSIPMVLSEVVAQAQEDTNNGRKTYSKLHKGAEVTIGIASFSAPSEGSHDGSLSSTTSEILEICPRFRLLIIGNSGVGKSSLIREVFGVKDVDVSEDSPGRADINKEFIAQENGLFVLHDSLGLEAGESDNFDKVYDFIKCRREKVVLKDRLHAVWICLAIPFAGGRLFEAGMEEFLQRRKEILGNVPMVVVLTKLDLLDESLVVDTWDTATVDSETEKAILQKRRDKFLLEHCINPLLLAAGNDIPWVAVSTEAERGLESTISELVKKTTSEIEQHVKADPSYAAMSGRSSFERHAPFYVAGMAQRASIEAKVRLTIAIGKKRYWGNLSASLMFSGEKVKEYLLVVHEDIIRGWNFNDPEMALRNDDFKGALLDACNLGVHEIRDPLGGLGPEMPLISVFAQLITDMIGVVFVLPAVGALILAKCFSEIYKSSQTIVKRFMAYIVDLVYVMKILFVLAPRGSITSQDVALALQVYEKSTYRNRIHLEIRDFSVGSKVFPGGRDSVMEKIEVLIGRFEITDKEVVELRSRIRGAPSVSDNVAATSY